MWRLLPRARTSGDQVAMRGTAFSRTLITALGASFMLAHSFAQAQVLPRPPARERLALQLLHRYLTAGQFTPYEAVQVTQTFGPAALESRQIVKYAGPRRQRIEYLSPPALEGNILLIAGSRILNFIARPTPRIVEGGIPDAARDTARDELRTALRVGRVAARYIGTQLVAGREAGVVEVRSGDGSPFKRLWLDNETGVRLKYETVDASGNTLAMSYMTRISYRPSFNPADFAPASLPPVRALAPILSTRPLRSVAEAEQEVGYGVRTPILPPRYHLVSVWVVGGRNPRTVFLRYSDGVNSLILSQRPLRDRASARATPSQGKPLRSFRGVAFWSSSERSYTLFGNVRPALLHAIVASLR